MQIKITGKHIDTGEALREHVENNIEASISKYFESGAETNIIFSKHYRSCKILRFLVLVRNERKK